jgi:transposase
MTSPIERVTVECLKCGERFETDYRASVNLALDP